MGRLAPCAFACCAPNTRHPRRRPIWQPKRWGRTPDRQNWDSNTVLIIAAFQGRKRRSRPKIHRLLFHMLPPPSPRQCNRGSWMGPRAQWYCSNKAFKPRQKLMNFASDNAAGVAPRSSTRSRPPTAAMRSPMAGDDLTAQVERRFCEIFEREVAVFLVPTGTAANALALAHLSPPWGAVLCHAEAHIIDRRMRGAGILRRRAEADRPPGRGRKDHHRDPAGGTRSRAVGRSASRQRLGPSSTQATEAGTVYRPDEIAALAAIAHGRGVAVHMDGARFANALARLDVSPAETTWKAGIDVLSLGATKAGALAAEAVVFFDRGARRPHGRAAQARRATRLQASLSSQRSSRRSFKTACG